MKSLLLGILLGGVALLPGAAFAHHGVAAFDMKTPTTVKGTVVSFDFGNPHPVLMIDVVGDDHSVQRWEGEFAASPAMLRRKHWNKDSVKAGEVVSLFGNRKKNGSKALRVLKVILSDGKELSCTPE